jgi:hypothetical protein
MGRLASSSVPSAPKRPFLRMRSPRRAPARASVESAAIPMPTARRIAAAFPDDALPEGTRES